MSKVLVVEDEPNLRKVLATLLRREGYEVSVAENGEQGLAEFERGGAEVVITDLVMPKVGGMEVLRTINARDPDVPVIIITAHGTVDSAVEAIKLGAFDYITKPFDQAELQAVIAKASRTVLTPGGRATGKAVEPPAPHGGPPRRDKPLIKINCAAIPKDLMESELFGYERGAFTGAVTSKPGRFELADGGTLFLDEIAEIPVEMQVKLLRVLQESEFERVGGIKTIRVDVRLVAATNRDLKKEIEAGRFRKDLFYRLNVVPIRLPALRQRAGDIPMLARHFIDKYNRKLNKHIEGITHEALAVLGSYSWPGNIRELENFIERILLFADGPLIGVADLPEHIRVGPPTSSAAAAQSVALAAGALPQPELIAAPAAEGGLKDLVRARAAELEKDLIIRALEETGGNTPPAAELLQIRRKSLQTNMKEFGLRGDAGEE